MRITIDIPDALQQALEAQLGQSLDQAAKETVAIAWYQAEKLSIGQVADMLGITVYEAQGLMKRQRVPAPYTVQDWEQDRNTLNRLLGS